MLLINSFQKTIFSGEGRHRGNIRSKMVEGSEKR
jgi:hypothetical protein